MDNYHIKPNGTIINNGTGKEVPQWKSQNGYMVVDLELNAKNPINNVHKLVALKYIPRPSKKIKKIRHIDGDRMNNDVSNLEWII